MEQKIELKHPEGKKAISMDNVKYNVLKLAIVECLKTKSGLTHKELKQAVTDYIENNMIQFSGSVPWHLEWIKLDLEAREVIKRIETKTLVKYSLWEI